MTLASHGRVVAAGLAKNWRLSVTYPSWLVNRLVGPIVWVALGVYSWLALAGQGDVESAFAAAGERGDLIGFLILGQTVFSFFSNLNFRGGMAIQRERWMGTLEMILLAPTSRVAYLLGESLFGLIDGGWTVLIAFVVTALAFQAKFAVADPWLALVAIALTLASMVALSLFFAAFYVLTRSAGPLSFAIQGPVRFFTGTTFPIASLPGALRAVSYAIPVTYGMLAVRAAFLGTGGWADLAGTLALLAGFTVLFLVVGIVLVGRMERLAKERGTLHTY